MDELPPPPRSRVRRRRGSSAVVLATAAAALSFSSTSCAATSDQETEQHISFTKNNNNNVPSSSSLRPTADPSPASHRRTAGAEEEEDADPQPNAYIIGGTDIPNLSAHPWFAATKFTSSQAHLDGSPYGTEGLHALQSWLGCGASLIASRYVVTAAHCVWDPYQDPSRVAAGVEKREALDPLRTGLEYRVGFSGYCPDQVSRNTYNDGDGDDGDEGKGWMEKAVQLQDAGENRIHVDEGGGRRGGASTTVMDENCGQPYEDIPAVSIHLHPANPDTGSVIDLAIVELAYPSTIPPVAVDTTGSVLYTIDQGSRMTVLGAGKTHGRYTYSPSQWNAALADELQSVEVGRVPVQHCVDQLQGLLDNGHLDGSMICSVSLSRLDKREELGTPCHGDSGGPLITQLPQTASSTNQDVLLGVVSVGKQNCNGEATAYTSVSYASGWMCSIMCSDALGLIAFADCPDWCYDEENGRYHGEVHSDGVGGSAIWGFTGDSHDGDEGTAYGLKKQQGRAHVDTLVDQKEDGGENDAAGTNRNVIDCEAEGNLEFLFRSKSKSCRWLGKSGRSKDRILRICSKTNAQDVCTGTCRSGNDRCVFSS